MAFDFDGTLTVADSFTAFLRWREGVVGWWTGLASLAPATARYLVDRDRGRIKAAAVERFLKGLPTDQLSAEAERFADAVWDRFMRPDALACWEDWGRKGAHRVIVTASPALTVAPFARRLGAEALLGTELVLDAEGRVTGAFAGELPGSGKGRAPDPGLWSRGRTGSGLWRYLGRCRDAGAGRAPGVSPVPAETLRPSPPPPPAVCDRQRRSPG